MARISRSAPARPALGRQPHRQSELVLLGPFEAEAEFPALAVATPDARVLLDSFEAEAEFPELTVTTDQRLTLAVFEAEAEFPALTVSIPIQPGDAMDGLPGQIEFNGFLLGRTTPYRWKNLVGHRDRPNLDSGNSPRASRHGSWPGRPLAQERVLTWTALLRAPRAEVEGAIDALEQALPVLEDEDELSLVVNDLGTPYLMWGRIDRLQLPLDPAIRIGLGQLTLQWVCSDPRRYGILRSGVTIPAGDSANVPNAGNVATHPLIRFHGPAVNPGLVNTTLSRQVVFGLTLGSGQVLEVDCDRGTAAIGTTNVIGTLAGTSVHPSDFVLGRSDNILTHTVTSGGVDVDVLYRDAWL